MSRPTPPVWACWLLEAAVPRGPEREAILGDFEEELLDLSNAAGVRAARAWFAAQVLLS